MERLGEVAPHSLAVCPGVTSGSGGQEGQMGQPFLLGFRGTPVPRGLQRDAFAHSQPNLLSESRALSFSAL